MSIINGGITIQQKLSGNISTNQNTSGSINESDYINGELTLDDVINGNVSKATTLYVTEIVFDKYSNFPVKGIENTLYVSTDSNSCGAFFYNTSTNQYESITVQDKNYIYTQLVASNQWNINHKLNKYPSVTVVDSGGNTVTGDVTYIDTNNVTINFSAEFTGKAYFN